MHIFWNNAINSTYVLKYLFQSVNKKCAISFLYVVVLLYQFSGNIVLSTEFILFWTGEIQETKEKKKNQEERDFKGKCIYK